MVLTDPGWIPGMGFPSGHMAVGQNSHVRALSFVYGRQDASAGTPGESGVLEGEADDAPPAQPEGQVHPTEGGSGGQALRMQNQRELSLGRDLLPALYKTRRIKERPCHRRLCRWGRASDRLPLSPGWWAVLKEAERVTPWSPTPGKPGTS